MAAISSVVTTGEQVALAVISGSGFGALQGASELIFWPSNGQSVLVQPVYWAAAEIHGYIPTGSSADIGKAAFFAVSVSGDPNPARSDSFTLLAVPVVVPTDFGGLHVFAPPGAESLTPVP